MPFTYIAVILVVNDSRRQELAFYCTSQMQMKESAVELQLKKK
jgi:hypothetical protein